ncbi:phosphatase PAP2 family protein [Mongoliitalea lutea]|uniref:Lipid A 4'-phosphatase n=1 Tax=Mongoliitalea lutea TaxID=849756 RepID=A0A8J3CVM9_9BACT|nr:phosphatase PAP2 family protein [Mongoliitalea lutea]GHB24118.1 lipid A 4'-phosphatase [Mongoliitalea lutea]
MIESIKSLDESLLLFFNGLHHPFMDPIMYTATQTWPWVPMYAFLLYLIWKTHGMQGWWTLIGIFLAVLFADQFTSSFMKPFFGRLRPCQNPDLAEVLHTYRTCGGKFGFASSHAANSFAVATLLWQLIGKKYPAVKWLFAWAVFFSYTRVYLGVHYPGDIIVGGIVGACCGYLAYLISHQIYRWTSSNKSTIE